MVEKFGELVSQLVKNNISLVLVFYASGFLSFIAYYRVLGVPQIEGDLRIYAEMAGKNLLVILQTFIFLITQPNYFIKNIDALNWAGKGNYVWSVCFILLISIELLLKWFSHYSKNDELQHNRLVIAIQLLLVILLVLTSLHIETQSFKAEHVLQPADFIAKYDQKRNLLRYEQKTDQVDIKRRSKVAVKLNNNPEEVVKHHFFSIPRIVDSSGNENKRINALMLMIIVVVITAIVLMRYRHYAFVHKIVLFYFLAQMILIPFNYGILGTSYQYPVISLDYIEKEKLLHKEAVFLLAKSQDKLIIYDRLNFFQIDYIPQDSVTQMKQFYLSSPFSNCTNGGFKPCELYAKN